MSLIHLIGRRGLNHSSCKLAARNKAGSGVCLHCQIPDAATAVDEEAAHRICTYINIFACLYIRIHVYRYIYMLVFWYIYIFIYMLCESSGECARKANNFLWARHMYLKDCAANNPTILRIAKADRRSDNYDDLKDTNHAVIRTYTYIQLYICIYSCICMIHMHVDTLA